jgi:hypothetical protein
VLWAMWLSYLWLFREGSMVHWIGLVIVIQNVVGSLFDSLVFDSTLGWTYVFNWALPAEWSSGWAQMRPWCHMERSRLSRPHAMYFS